MREWSARWFLAVRTKATSIIQETHLERPLGDVTTVVGGSPDRFDQELWPTFERNSTLSGRGQTGRTPTQKTKQRASRVTSTTARLATAEERLDRFARERRGRACRQEALCRK